MSKVSEALSMDEIDALLTGIDSCTGTSPVKNKKYITLEYGISIEYDQKELNRIVLEWIKKNAKIKIGVVK